MKKKIIYILLSMFVSIGILESCKKKENTPAVPEKKISDAQVNTAKGIKEEEPPRSQKKFGEFEADGKIVASPTAFNNVENPESQQKIGILLGNNAAGTKSFSTGIGGWESADYAIFFEPEGSYLWFDYKTSSWDWGYYYVNKEVNYIVFDPQTQYEDKWTVFTLSNTLFSMKNKTGATVNMNTTFMAGFEYQYLATDPINIDPSTYLKSKKWYLYTEDPNNTATCGISLGTKYREFLDNGIGKTINGSVNKTWTWTATRNQYVPSIADLTITEDSVETTTAFAISGDAFGISFKDSSGIDIDETYITQEYYNLLSIACSQNPNTTLRKAKK